MWSRYYAWPVFLFQVRKETKQTATSNNYKNYIFKLPVGRFEKKNKTKNRQKNT